MTKKRRTSGHAQQEKKSAPQVSFDTTPCAMDFVLDCTIKQTVEDDTNAGRKPLTQSLTQDWTLPTPELSDKEEDENEISN